MTSALPALRDAGRLDQLIGPIDLPAISGEVVCLSIGDLLNRAFEDFQKLTGSFATVEGVFNGEEVEVLASTVAQARATVAGLIGGLSAECDKIEVLVRLNQDLATRLSLIHRSVRTISAMATNSRVEAASIDTRSGEISNFAAELVALAKQAQRSIDGCCDEQAVLSRMLLASRRTFAEFRRAHGGDLALVERDLEHVGGSIDAHRTRLVQAAAELGERAKDITRAIGTIVMALQIGDSTRQRLEHAIDCLRDASRLYDGVSEAEARTAGRVACGLAARQVAGARHDFEQAIGQIEDSLKKLAGQAEEIVGAANAVAKAGDGRSRSFMDDIATRLGTALQLSQTAGSARTAADGFVAEIIRTTAELEGQMGLLSDVTESMTIIGVNAVLKARRVGVAGLGLGVIADLLRSGATRVVTDVKLLAPALGVAVVETKGLADMFSTRHAEHLDQDTTRAKQALGALARCDAEIRTALETLVGTGGRVAQDLARTASSSAIALAADQMNDLCNALEDLAAGPSSLEAPGLDLSRLERAAAERYTMKSERQIHAGYWDALRGSRPEATIAA